MIALAPFVQDSENPDRNFDLGLEYESLGHTGAAISFYLRAAERSRDDLQQYHALLRMALCLQRQKLRDDSQAVLLQKSIGLLPRRPEAYFLLARLYEWQKQWHESYWVASVGCSVSDFGLVPLGTNVEYPGEYGLWFQKAVALWWVGNCDQSRELLLHIRANYQMHEIYTAAVDANLDRIGRPRPAP